tara:strand:- start:1069 stop:1656 length:588 start_codon:yes stop_codon:yes gene_type:complete
MSKLLYLIRHGTALHNDNFLKYGVKTFYDPKFKDTRLTNIGHGQSNLLNENWNKINDIDLVLVSPLYRTLQTAENIFKGVNVPIIALEDLREYPYNSQTCNYRSNKITLENDFPHINFNNISVVDEKFNIKETETIESLENRISNINKYILNRKENTICIVSHSIFLEKMKDNKISLIEQGEKELEHCYPYEYHI